jgi:hypothetical protein
VRLVWGDGFAFPGGDAALGKVVITATGQQVVEGDDLTFTVRLSVSQPVEVSVEYQTVADSAEADVDYQSTGGVLTFAPGETEKQIIVPTVADKLYEATEELTLTLFNSSIHAAFIDLTLQGTIENITLASSGETIFTSPGTYNWTVPEGVTTVHAVAVGGGGGGGLYSGLGRVSGGGGGLGWKNNIPVTPGEQITIVVGVGGGLKTVGGDSSFGNGLVIGEGGSAYTSAPQTGSYGNKESGGYVGDGGGRGGSASFSTYTQNRAAGGGAGGYTGNGGRGRIISSSDRLMGKGGSGGGGAGGGAGSSGGEGYAGGGVGLYGEGENGIYAGDVAGAGGSGGSAGNVYVGGSFGGGGGDGETNSRGGHGAVRVIWGQNRSFPYEAHAVPEEGQ